MTFRQAKKLHNEDEVMVKETGEIVTVINAYVEDKNVMIECCTYDRGYCTLTHKEIK